jgi:hypothetical protein
MKKRKTSAVSAIEKRKKKTVTDRQPAGKGGNFF